MAKKKDEEQEEQANLHKELKGFDIRVNEFGQIISTFPVDKLNKFLNDKTDDKKLRDRKDLQEGEDSSEGDSAD